jgi:two-component system NtrC family sensor kinase
MTNYDAILPAIKDVLIAIRQRRRVDEILELILDRGCRLAHAVHGSFMLVEDATGRLVITSTHGPDWKLEQQNCRLLVGQGITGQVAKTGLPYLCRDTSLDPHYYRLFDYVRSEMAVPVMVHDQVWGVLNFDGMDPDSFDEEALATLSVFGELASFAITLRIELTEQERLQKNLVQKEKLASLGEVIAGIAHEINNPLTSILAHASLLTLKRGGEEDEKSLVAITSEARRTATLVRNLLAFSRKSPEFRETVGINDLIQQVAVLKAYQLKLINIELLVDLDVISYPVLVRHQQIQQVLLSLIHNAEHAIGPNRSDGFIRLATQRKGQSVVVSVADNGHGIPHEVRHLVFDPFFTTKEFGKGAGLGLSMAQSMIEAHGGNLEFTSDLGLGTTFTLTLPLAESPESSADPESQNGGCRLQGLAFSERAMRGHILIVDDEPEILDSLCELLHHMNIRCTLARDGAAALGNLRKEAFDAILSDIRMPGMDGIELYRQAVALDATYSGRFVFMSGDLVRDSTRDFLRGTHCPCLEKPFLIEGLLKSIEPHLAESKRS